MALLIRNGRIFTNDDVATEYDRGDIQVVGERIAAIGADLTAEAARHPISR